MYGGEKEKEDDRKRSQDADARCSETAAAPPPPPWLVRAEVTIRHGGIQTNSDCGQSPVGASSTVTDSNGVRMIYRWNTSQPNINPPSTTTTATTTTAAPVPSMTSSMGTIPPNSYGFQRGNILFTSTPPPRSQPSGSFTIPRSGFSMKDDSNLSKNRGFNDSGYNSERFSPQSYSSLPSRRSSQQYNRRCKSTCNIVLAAFDPKKNLSNDEFITTKSQTREPLKFSTLEADRPPWHSHRMAASHHHHHHHNHQQQQHVSARSRFSTVPEVCEDCAEGSTASPFTTHFCTRVLEKTANKRTTISKDASSQTTDIESRSSSLTTSKTGKIRRKALDIFLADEQKRKKQENPPIGASIDTTTPQPSTTTATTTDTEKSDASTVDENTKRKSRTVHIDVYCTGSDEECSTESSEEERSTTAMTVFENKDVKVTHTQQTTDNDLPRGFTDNKAFLARTAERRCESFKNAPMRMPSLASSKGYESDDLLSSLYPSQFSSYSALKDIDSTPWSAASSMIALPFPDDYDSAAATSAKDTFSDIESIVNGGKPTLTPCDSFEYANSSDRERIRKMETIWGNKTEPEEKDKTWRSPQIERKHLLRNRKMREYLEKHEIGWSSDDTAAESDDSGTIGWTFIANKDHSEEASKKKDIITPTSQINSETAENVSPNVVHHQEPKRCDPSDDHSDSTTRSELGSRTYTLRDQIGLFSSKSPSPLPSKVPSRVTSPFMTPQGERTDHIVKASIFGSVIGAFRKPGHHVGPAKNPNCSCEHCRRYFEEDNTRERSCSIGEPGKRSARSTNTQRNVIRPAPTSYGH